MKRVINGLIYDTNMAEEIADFSNGLGARDFRNVEESLYRTANGRFFLCGSGGPMTRYATACGDAYTSGEKIIPLDEREAREWCEQHGVDAETIEANFPVEPA